MEGLTSSRIGRSLLSRSTSNPRSCEEVDWEENDSEGVIRRGSDVTAWESVIGRMEGE